MIIQVILQLVVGPLQQILPKGRRPTIVFRIMRLYLDLNFIEIMCKHVFKRWLVSFLIAYIKIAYMNFK